MRPSAAACHNICPEAPESVLNLHYDNRNNHVTTGDVM